MALGTILRIVAGMSSCKRLEVRETGHLVKIPVNIFEKRCRMVPET